MGKKNYICHHFLIARIRIKNTKRKYGTGKNFANEVPTERSGRCLDALVIVAFSTGAGSPLLASAGIVFARQFVWYRGDHLESVPTNHPTRS
jgi:hypothetical protein